MNRVLIIGAAGQDGALLSERLKAEGTDYIGMTRQGAVLPDGTLLQRGTLSDNRFVSDVVAKFVPTEVFYLAAHHHSSQQLSHSIDTSLWQASFEVQVLGLGHTLDALRLHAPSAKLFYASSSHIFGSPMESPQNESTPTLPTNVYGVSKITGAEVCRYYRDQFGLFVSIGIFYNHESILRRETFLSKKVIQAAFEIKQGSRQELVLGSLSAEADWGYAPDYVDAMIRILKLDRADTFVVATGEKHSVRDFVQLAFEYHGLDYREWVKEDPSLTKSSSVQLVGDSSKLRKATDWSPSVSFSQMIRLLSHEYQMNHQGTHE